MSIVLAPKDKVSSNPNGQTEDENINSQSSLGEDSFHELPDAYIHTLRKQLRERAYQLEITLAEQQQESPETLEMIGRADFVPSEDLSENAYTLYQWILGDACNSEFLEYLVLNYGLDIEAGIEELRGYGLLDESNPNLLRILRRKL